MNKHKDLSIDVCILTEQRYVDKESNDPYVVNILKEDSLVQEALEERGLRVERRRWDDPWFDWSDTAFVLFRSTWDYFDRFPKFSAWLDKIGSLTRMINSQDIITWNLDKHYLQELSASGINIPPSIFMEKGESESLAQKVAQSKWNEIILKPVVSGAARHTYRFSSEDAKKYEAKYRELIREEAMMIQEFQEQVPLQGEVSFIVVDGLFTHAILKKAKKGDFRVQDDFGGTLHPYRPSSSEIEFAERTVALCGRSPLYARVDAIRDNQGKLALSELELIEPELWFRFHPPAAGKLADAIMNRYFTI
jgi:glutathione synthase/RimK-type ligase-like ATP-grasp enzyme